MSIKADLDTIDWKILKNLQEYGRMTNVQLAGRVGISAPPCLRRMKRLEKTGMILGYHARLNTQALGFEVVAFCFVGLHHQSEAGIKAFSALVNGWPLVRQAWTMSGETDFILHCIAPDLPTFQDFVIRQLTAAPNVDTVRTALTIGQVKSAGLVPIEMAPNAQDRLTGKGT